MIIARANKAYQRGVFFRNNLTQISDCGFVAISVCSCQSRQINSLVGPPGIKILLSV